MKNIFILFLLFKCSIAFSAPTILNPGDIAIIGFNFKNPDEFSFVIFEELTEGTIIYFTDCGWMSSKTFRKGEGLITYTVPAGGEKAFDIITYPSDPGFVTSGISGFFGFSVEGDQIIAFQGTFDSPQFIYAINSYNNAWQADAIDNNSSTQPDGLQDGTTSIVLDDANANYNCYNALSKDKLLLLASLSNPANWTTSSQRVTMQTNCFSILLPIILQSFSIQDSDNGMKAFIEIQSDERIQITLEESGDGINFIDIESNMIEQSVHQIFFHSILSKNYCRIKIISNTGVVSYSEIKQIPYGNKNIIALYLYNLQGEIIYSCIECNEGDLNTSDIKKSSQPIIMRKIYNNSTSEVIKLIEK